MFLFLKLITSIKTHLTMVTLAFTLEMINQSLKILKEKQQQNKINNHSEWYHHIYFLSLFCSLAKKK